MARFVSADRRQRMLMPPDMKEWVPKDDLAHFVIEAVERLPLEKFRVRSCAGGEAQYPPHMMLALLIYSYANGIFSSRRIERVTYRDIGVRYVSADTHPDHDTLCKFRRENECALIECFEQVLVLAKEMGLLRVGTVSVDGTKVQANASGHRNVRYDRAGELSEQLRLEIKGLLERAEQADASGETDPQALPEEWTEREKMLEEIERARVRLQRRQERALERERSDDCAKAAAGEADHGSGEGSPAKPPETEPEDPKPSEPTEREVLAEELARRETLLEKMQQARRHLQQRRQKALEREREDYRRKVAARDARRGRGKGPRIKPPLTEPEGREQSNLTDPDSRLMKSSSNGAYLQAYNAQAVVDAQGSQLVLGVRVSDCASDANELLADVATVSKELGEIRQVLADSGYANGRQVEKLQEEGIDVLVAVKGPERRAHDLRPKPKNKPKPQMRAPWRLAMEKKLQDPKARKTYALRQQTVEPVFGIVKQAMGFRQFLTRGMDNVSREWLLVSMAYNFRRMHSLGAPAAYAASAGSGG